MLYTEDHALAGDGSITERRRERRVSVACSGVVTLISPIDRTPRTVEVVDVSKMGLKLLSDRRIQRGVILQVRMNDLLVMGAVRHCTPHEGQFHVGVAVEQMLRRTQRQTLLNQ